MKTTNQTTPIPTEAYLGYQVIVDDEDEELDDHTIKVRDAPRELYMNSNVYWKIKQAYGRPSNL